jgi:hypothetical protein
MRPLFRVALELPEALGREVLAAAWWDGARTGALAGLLAGLAAGYLLWRRAR